MPQTKKANPASPHKNKYVIFIVACILGLVIVICLLYFSTPKTDADYFVKALDKIGAPSSYSAEGQDDVRHGPLQADYARRYYTTEVVQNFAAVRDEIITRMQRAGFDNAKWRERSGTNAAGILATCRGVTIFVRIDQEDGSLPVDIEVFESDTGLFPRCPDM